MTALDGELGGVRASSARADDLLGVATMAFDLACLPSMLFDRLRFVLGEGSLSTDLALFGAPSSVSCTSMPCCTERSRGVASKRRRTISRSSFPHQARLRLLCKGGRNDHLKKIFAIASAAARSTSCEQATIPPRLRLRVASERRFKRLGGTALEGACHPAGWCA